MQIDWWTLALQTVNFLIVVWLLGRFLYRPVRRIIDEREAADRRAADAAEAKAETAEAVRKDFERKRAELEAAEQQRDAALHESAEAERRAMLDAAEEKAAKLIADARAKIDRERKDALGALCDDIAGLAHDLAAKALASAPADAAGALARVTTHLDQLAERELSDLRRDLGSGADGLILSAQGTFRAAERKKWAEALSARFGGASVTFEENPGLLGGVELRFPHAVMDFSVAGALRRAAAGIAE